VSTGENRPNRSSNAGRALSSGTLLKTPQPASTPAQKPPPRPHGGSAGLQPHETRAPIFPEIKYAAKPPSQSKNKVRGKAAPKPRALHKKWVPHISILRCGKADCLPILREIKPLSPAGRKEDSPGRGPHERVFVRGVERASPGNPDPFFRKQSTRRSRDKTSPLNNAESRISRTEHRGRKTKRPCIRAWLQPSRNPSKHS
jgi:hypothetical protein